MANLDDLCKKILKGHWFKIRHRFQRFVTSLTRIPQRLIHIAEYLPLLWHDRHWDYRFIFDLLDFKLRKMEDTLRNSNINEDSEDVCKSIRTCRNLLSRSQDENWHILIQKRRLEEKWEGPPIFWQPSKLFDYPPKTRMTVIIAPKKALVEGRLEEFRKEYRQAAIKAEKKRKRDLKIALKIFQKYHETWWD